MPGPEFEADEVLIIQRLVDPDERKGLAEPVIQDPLSLRPSKLRDAVSRRGVGCPKTASMQPSREVYALRCTNLLVRPVESATSSVYRLCNSSNTLRSLSRCMASDFLAIKRVSEV